MKILCVSASNSRKNNEDSVSYNVMARVKKSIETKGDHEVKLLSLRDYDIAPCQLCGDCSKTEKCTFDSGFNEVLHHMKNVDRMLFVVPHYSPIPSKLIALFEKINEITYAGWLNDSSYISPVQGKGVAVIGHGGMTESPEVLTYYQEAIVKPVSRTLMSLGLKPIKPEPTDSPSDVFGLLNDGCLMNVDGQIFPEIIIDWDRVAARIEPLVDALVR